MKSSRLLLCTVFLLCAAAAPLESLNAGGSGPGCAGIQCGPKNRTFHPDPVGSHLPGAVCPVGYAFCTNLSELEQERQRERMSEPLQDFLEWAFGPIRDAPSVVYSGEGKIPFTDIPLFPGSMGETTPGEDLAAELTGGLGVELPKLALDLIGDATPNLPPIMGRLRGVGAKSFINERALLAAKREARLAVGEETVTYWRADNPLRPMFETQAGGNLTFRVSGANKNKPLYLSRGGPEHIQHFVGSGAGERRVISFEVPRWLDDLIQETTIPQTGARAHPRFDRRLGVQAVDPHAPGNPLQFGPGWRELFEEAIIPGSTVVH